MTVPVRFLLSLFMLPALASAQRFTCEAKPGAGQARLTAETRASATAGGFDLNASPTDFKSGTCSSDKPFFFSVPATDGSYRVTVALGSPVASVVTVRAESRRLFVDRDKLAAGAAETVTFNVNVRTAAIAGADATANPATAKVKLKPREIGALDWDDKLTLEFNGEHPRVRAITIEPVRAGTPTVYLAGDSTVVDQDKEPWAAWGQMLPVFFGPGVTISNQAESGETIRSFLGERRWDKILSTLKPGDTVMIQFAHNDQKGGTGNVPAQTDYKMYLKRYIAEAKAKGASTILVTSMNRRNFDADGKIVQTLGEYPAAMREVGTETGVPVIDLNALSKTLFEAMGPDGTLKAFVHYPANSFPGQAAELKDDTHFNSYGAYELAKAVVQAVRDQKLPLAGYLRKEVATFNPAKPDAVAAFQMPQSPMVSTDTPYERK